MHFANALRKGFVPLSQETLYDEQVVKWAYNVALTRFHEVWQPSRQKLIAPMADMVSRRIRAGLLFSVCALEYEFTLSSLCSLR